MSKVFSLIITINLPNAVIFHSTFHSLYMYIKCLYIFFACNSEAKVPPRRGKKIKKKCFDHHQCNELLYWTWIPASLLIP